AWWPRSSACSAPGTATRRPIATPASCSKRRRSRRACRLRPPAVGAWRPSANRLCPMASATATVIRGTARLGRPTQERVRRLGPGDVAVIDHRNLDRIAAEELAGSGVRATLNVAPSSDGTYPNTGPLTLVRAGVRLIDVMPELFDLVSDGDPLEIDGGRVRSGERRIAEGRVVRSDGLSK